MKARERLSVPCQTCGSDVLLDLMQASEALTHYERACICGTFVLLSFSPQKASTREVKRAIDESLRVPMWRRR